MCQEDGQWQDCRMLNTLSGKLQYVEVFGQVNRQGVRHLLETDLHPMKLLQAFHGHLPMPDFFNSSHRSRRR
jgi:hypothetical protein